MGAGPESRKFSKRIFETLLIKRMIQDANMILPPFLNPDSRSPPELDGLQPGQNVISIRDYLDIEPVPGPGEAKGDALFVVCYDCHGGNLPLKPLRFKCFALNGARPNSSAWHRRHINYLIVRTQNGRLARRRGDRGEQGENSFSPQSLRLCAKTLFPCSSGLARKTIFDSRGFFHQSPNEFRHCRINESAPRPFPRARR
jgi:hypothetical protein